MTLEHDELAGSLTRRCGGAGHAGAAASGHGKKQNAEKVEKMKPKWGEPGSGKAKEGKAKDTPPAPEVPIPVTPEGEKKDLSGPMAATYCPKAVDVAWSAWWEKRGFFTPDPKAAKNTSESKRFIMVIPPPNVTGSLHIGHTLMVAIEDALTRWHRMCGDVTLWLPGTDHAGIATQSVVERLLYKNEKLTRHDLGREKFLERIWAWKEKNGNRIKLQLNRNAASTDWTRERFTMDKMLNKAVVEAFIRFHDQGLIYRDFRLVHWSSFLRTSLSDLEVDHEDIPGKTFLEIPGYKEKVEVGVLCEFKYLLKGSPEKALVVATTRVETMLGDTAVAVHPEDPRYKDCIGKEVTHPFFPERRIVVVADSSVDREFGTGCVKITPAHDFNDFKLGQRHNLEMISIFSEEGNINEKGGPFSGQGRFEARRKVEDALKEKGLWVSKKSHAMRLGLCSRSKDIVEPFMKPQWWMNCQDLARRSVEAVRDGSLKIIPEDHHKTWFHWLENIQEWCISRQLWWGHRIPAYRVVKPPQAQETWVTGRSMEEAVAKAEKKLDVKGVQLTQDEDVLDTWFSSGLFPFSTMGWPDTEGNEDFEAFFPTSLLETGHDILFFWVARMVMMSLGLLDKLPFHSVYLHAMVRDAHGRKMSKSLGNVIDPIEVIEGISLEDLHKKIDDGNLPEKEVAKAKLGQSQDYPKGIPECGADALRFGLLAYTMQGKNVNLDIDRVCGYRRFCNKVWNATHFAHKYFNEGFKLSGSLRLDAPFAWEDRWILSKLSACAEKSNKAFESYEFANVTTATYSFFLYEFCDVYLELLKPRFYGEAEGAEVEADRQAAREVLYVCLDWSYRLMHPLLPYVTEELYQRLPPSPARCESIVVAPYPTHVIAWTNEAIEQEMEVVSEIARQFRSFKASLGLPPGARPAAFVRHADADARRTLQKLESRISRMALIGDVKILDEEAKPPAACLRDVVHEKCTIFMEVAGLDLSQNLATLGKKVVSAERMVQSYEVKMAAPGYEDKVPAPVREQNAQKLEAARLELAELGRAKASIEETMRS